MDLYEVAKALRVVDVWKPGNETGWVTPRVLYDPALGMAPALERFQYWIDHGTVGSNTLAFWGEGGSAKPGNWSLAHSLVPHESTVYKDGRAHDTTLTVFKMVPPGYACNNVGPAIGPISNANTLSMEYESLQNGTADISDWQYIKGALMYAHDVAQHGIPDWFRLAHGIVAVPWGRRSDPWAGKFKIARSFELVQAIRRDPRIWAFWGMPQPEA